MELSECTIIGWMKASSQMFSLNSVLCVSAFTFAFLNWKNVENVEEKKITLCFCELNLSF